VAAPIECAFTGRVSHSDTAGLFDASVALKDRQEAWHEWFRPVLDVTTVDQSCSEFLAENSVWKLGVLVMSRVSAPAEHVVQTKAQVRRDPVDHWVLTYAQRGAMLVKADKASFEVPPCVPYLWSLGEESESERTRVDRVQFFLPRDGFRDIAPLLDAARGTVWICRSAICSATICSHWNEGCRHSCRPSCQR
jgi:hypothetical protein